MAARLDDIKNWFDQGISLGATHMIVVCDTFDFEDFPVMVYANDDPRKMVDHYKSLPLTKVMEVYNLSMSKDEQCQGNTRVFNY